MKKVFYGPIDLGLNQIFKEEMQKQGYNVTTCNFVEHKNFGWKNDIELKINKMGFLEASNRVFNNFIKSLNYDIYHFKFGQSLLPWNLDLPILKILGKKIVMSYHGLDIRQLNRFKKDKFNQIMVEKIGYSFFDEFKKTIRHHWIKNWVDIITVSTPDLLEFAKEAEFVPEMAPLDRVQRNENLKPKNSNLITILHAPSHRGIKGTEYIIKSVNKLKREKFSVELLLAENIPADRMSEYFQKADIVIDQLLIGSYGVVTIEATLAKKPVICYIRNDLRRFYPDDLPVLTASPDTLENVLRDLIKDKARRKEVGQDSFGFVKIFHNPEILSKKWGKIYKSIK
jgi:glycosyltransferase involved in cell wall biosynthesis